jgi:hypothetical protein
MKRALTYGTGLIALYLAVNYATGTKSTISAGAGGLSQIIRSLQGRN